MLNQNELERYSSHLMLNGFGLQGQIHLKNAKVLCVGVGGIASPLLYYLVAAGIGKLTIIDKDRVSLSNLTRQFLYNTDDIGQLKVRAAKKQLQRLNQETQIDILPTQFAPNNADHLVNNHDVIADCTDNFKSKLLINDTCFRNQKIFMTGSAIKHTGHFVCFNGQSGPCYRCLFEFLELDKSESCNELGVLSPLLGIIGSLQAIEIIKYLTGNACDYGLLIEIDALTLKQKKYKINVNPQCPLNHDDKGKFTNSIMQVNEIRELTTLEEKNFLLIDVRSQAEHRAGNRGGQCIPLHDLADQVFYLSKSQPIVLYCESGKRSRIGCEFLLLQGFQEVYSWV